MRILFDSKSETYKSPFGCVAVGQACRLTVHIPKSVEPREASVVFLGEDGSRYRERPLFEKTVRGDYTLWECCFVPDVPALLFYYFTITGYTGTFRLFKQGKDTNMEAGDLWQLTCIPGDFHTPDWAKGEIIYQVFPDRFCKVGETDLSGKLMPYVLHENWYEDVLWQRDGVVLNNDFYGGNFRGITEKLPYIASLGTGILYLNPICKSFSSHRYDTADYKTPDPMLGTAEDFEILCRRAHALGIRVILDGVFSHTGANSLYFDKEGTFGGRGAYSTADSAYFDWFTFHEHPHRYDCWWGFDTLPTVNKENPAFMDYIFAGEDSVIAYWLGLGADGFRLDVADELPNGFLKGLKTALRRLRPDALLVGEVWEDASNKMAYGQRRRYFVDGTLDSVMNYPWRTAILCFLQGLDDGTALAETVMEILENYPREVVDCNMNLLGSHDTQRLATALGGDRALQLAATAIQYALPGCPSLYYGDEVGMEGEKDPFNRRTYPWGKEDQVLLNHYRALGRLRQQHPALRRGDTAFFQAGGGRIGFSRIGEAETIECYVNRSEGSWTIPGGQVLLSHGLDKKTMTLGATGFCIMKVNGTVLQ